MANRLVTGVPGAGKTLYAVARIIKPMVGARVKLDDGREVQRRICVAGIRDLLLEHEPIDVPQWDPEAGRLNSGGRQWAPDTEERKPGEPPHDCERRADNWWRWCEPGDLIVVDECQRLFRPMAAGRKLPMFITMLETHRHFGVDFLFITQHPQLLHANVRNLIGHHNHVRRMFGGATTVIYEWDHCTSPDRIKAASTTYWRHAKAAYGLYKSAEVHTKSKHRLPLPVYVLGAMLIVLPALGWTMYQRAQDRYGSGAKAAAAKPASAPAKGTGVGARDERTPLAPPAVAPVASAPAAAASAPVRWAGCIAMARRCECIDADGYSREVDLAWCERNARRGGVDVPYPMTPAATTVAAMDHVAERNAPVEAAPMVHGFDAGDYRQRSPRR